MMQQIHKPVLEMEVIVPEWLRDATANDNFAQFGETIDEHGCEMLTHYEVLEISESASAEVIRAAHRSLSAKYHPDKDKSPEGRDRFLQVQKAFEVLSDEMRRREYDRSLRSHGPQQPNTEAIVMRIDGTSSFLTLSEHLKRSGSELANCDLSGVDLRGISLRAANLSGAKLDGAVLAGCDFSNANLTKCSALSCDFDGVQFGGANLTGANFRGSSMIKATFYQVGAIMGTTEKSQSFRFSYYDDKSRVVDKSVETKATTLHTVNFSHCDLRGAVFVAPPTAEETASTPSATLGVERNVPFFLRQTFTSCTFRECNFSKSNLHQVDLHGMNLSGVDFSGANLYGANLVGCDIQGLDLSECNLVNANLHQVAYNTLTKLPMAYPLPVDAIDKDAERARLQEQENQHRVNQEILVMSFVILLFGFALIVGLLAHAS
ncbi:MAG: pentapeptide repeat-containing protein [Planctomycetaceae bacterium]|nr:pentapeptide repeat-containing protein [Planctomycetaceae bacterium]